MKSQLLVAAAGQGTRLGGEQPKALIDVAGKPMLVRTLARFAPMGLVPESIIVIPAGREDAFEEVLQPAFPGTAFVFVQGGPKRQDSVANGLEALVDETDTVVIHDAARPFVQEISIKASLEAAAACGAATVATPCIDTILETDDDLYLQATPDRTRLWACQTPQTFQVRVIREAHAKARRDGFIATDDATLVRHYGGRVKLVQGSPLNFKVTTPEHLALARYVAGEKLA